MKLKLLTLLAALTAMSAPLVVRAKDNPTGISAAEQAQLQRALNRGRLIYAYDQTAWHGTDDMRVKLPDAASKIGGWVVDGPADRHISFSSAATLPIAAPSMSPISRTTNWYRARYSAPATTPN